MKWIRKYTRTHGKVEMRLVIQSIITRPGQLKNAITAINNYFNGHNYNRIAIACIHLDVYMAWQVYHTYTHTCSLCFIQIREKYRIWRVTEMG